MYIQLPVEGIAETHLLALAVLQFHVHLNASHRPQVTPQVLKQNATASIKVQGGSTGRTPNLQHPGGLRPEKLMKAEQNGEVCWSLLLCSIVALP